MQITIAHLRLSATFIGIDVDPRLDYRLHTKVLAKKIPEKVIVILLEPHIKIDTAITSYYMHIYTALFSGQEVLW